jgi:hypothetical protein
MGTSEYGVGQTGKGGDQFVPRGSVDIGKGGEEKCIMRDHLSPSFGC